MIGCHLSAQSFREKAQKVPTVTNEGFLLDEKPFDMWGIRVAITHITFTLNIIIFKDEGT